MLWNNLEFSSLVDTVDDKQDFITRIIYQAVHPNGRHLPWLEVTRPIDKLKRVVVGLQMPHEINPVCYVGS